MNKDEAMILIRDLINKIYNSTNITDDILDEVEVDLKEISSILRETQFSRELGVFIKSARAQENLIARNNFKFLILSNLEKRYRRLKIGE